MNATVSIPLLVYVPACAVALGVAHVLLSRRQAVGRRPVSPQASLARLILMSNVPALAGAAVIAWYEARPLREAVSMLVFSGIVYNGIAYAYFHVFNMSETARRIRILLHVLIHNDVNAEDLRDDGTLPFRIFEHGEELFFPRGTKSVARHELRPKHVRRRVFREHLAKRNVGDIKHRREGEKRFFEFFPESESHNPLQFYTPCRHQDKQGSVKN